MRRPLLAALGAILLAATAASAAEVPVAGRRIALRAGQQRSARIVLRDPAIAPPFADPTNGAALLVSGGAGPGQCRGEIALDPANWRPLGDDGAGRGWRYRAKAPGTRGVRRVLLRPGRLVVTARGADWPCDLAADTERVPLTVEVRVDLERYCAAFGGSVERNVAGRFAAQGASAPQGCPETDLTVANLNVLHGIFCPPGSGQCRLAERVDLIFQWIAGSGCPDVVTFQEIQSAIILPLITPHLATTCPFPYQLAFQVVIGIDDEMVLSRYPPLSFDVHTLYKGFRRVVRARIDHPIGPLDVYSTHLASSSDGAQSPCAVDCPPECVAAGAATRRECQAVQVAAYVAATHDVATPAVVTGDFNDGPGTFVYAYLNGQGWIDTYLAAGNPECDPGTGIGCTSGRDDDSLGELESPASNEVERIDFAFLVPPGPGSLCSAGLDPAADLDGDGSATRIFADLPNPFAPTCGALPEAICWPSDHEGAELDLECR